MKSTKINAKPFKKTARNKTAAKGATSLKAAASTLEPAASMALAAPRDRVNLRIADEQHPAIPAPNLSTLRGSYADVLDYLAQLESCALDGNSDLRETIEADAIRQLASNFPGVPRDYLDYLSEVGWGTFLDCRYTIYPRLVSLETRVGARPQPSWPIACSVSATTCAAKWPASCPTSSGPS